jgi:putative Ig domain-containing protein
MKKLFLLILILSCTFLDFAFGGGSIIVLGNITVSGGNGNSKIDPNECNQLTIELGNNGNVTATGVSAVLSSTTPNVTITQPNSTYPDIPPSSLVTNNTPFEVSTSSSFACGRNVFFTLTVTSSAGTDILNFILPTGNNYTLTESTASIVSGTTDIGVHCDDCTAVISIPFPYFYYSQQMLSAAVSSNGNLQFISNDSTPNNQCLPASNLNMPIMPYWDDLVTDNPGDGIFTSISGTAPNRIFNIEWATQLISGGDVDFEVRLYEDRQRVDLIFGTVSFSGLGATVGIQKDTGSAFFEYSCDSASLFNTLMVTFENNVCTAGNGSCISCPTITLSPSVLPDGSVGVAYNQTILASGGTAPYTFAITSGTLPDGLNLDSNTAVISGTPTAVGSFPFTITATDNNGCQGAQNYTIHITQQTNMFFDDFEDGVLAANWTYIKSSSFWNEFGGNLTGTYIKKTSAIASPAFSGCINCYVEASVRTAGGSGNRVWLMHHFIDKSNTIELLMKEETDRWIIKQRIGKKVVAKAKAQSAIDPNVFYTARITFDGTSYIVSVDGTTLITLQPVGPVSGGTFGFKVKGTAGSFGYAVVN